MIGTIKKITKNLSDNMLLYTTIAIISGVLLGQLFNLKMLSGFIIPIVLIMIYPMMVNLSLSSLRKIHASAKPLVEALILNFVYAPAFMWVLTSLFTSDPKIKLALMMLSIAPASSMGLGYIGLAEGHVLTGAIIVAFAFIFSVFVYPFLGHWFAAGASIDVPISLILKNLTVVLVVPLLLGVVTREYIERKHGKEKYLKVKPYFSAVTLSALYLLIFTIFASKSALIVKNYMDILVLLPIAILYYGITTLFVTFLNRKVFDFEYGHHQAVVFTTVSKNVAMTIAILVAVFGKTGQYMAVFPAIMSLFQAPFLMIYLKFSHKIKELFSK